MGLVTYLLEQSPVYSLWQAPFAADKLAPLLAHNDIRRVRRVLDVGCGPGTNTALFTHADYLGIDINRRYIENARCKHKGTFVVADIATYDDPGIGQFDFILINSFLHHVDDQDTHKILSRVAGWVTKDGHVHVLELVLPNDRWIAHILAKWDRGRYPRTLEHWRRILEEHLDIVVFEPYALRWMGATLWKMVYCKGKAKR